MPREDLRLRRIDLDVWVIEEGDHPSGDTRVHARLREIDESRVEVVWRSSAIPLPHDYASVEAALADLERWRSRRVASERPVPIPHLRPRHPQLC